MGALTDSKLREILERIAKRDNVRIQNIGSFLISHRFDEFKSRKRLFDVINSVLRKVPIDVENLAVVIKEKGFVLHGSIGLRVQTKDFLNRAEAGRLLEELVGDFAVPPDEATVDYFINRATDIAFKQKDGKKQVRNAALFASVMLTSVFPKSFVDYRIGRWKWISDVIDLEKLPDNPTIGAEILWAGRVAGELAETEALKEYFRGSGIELNWCAAALTYLLGKAPELKVLVDGHQQWNKIIGKILKTSPMNWAISRDFFHHFYQDHIIGEKGGWNGQAVERVLRTLEVYRKKAGISLTQSFTLFLSWHSLGGLRCKQVFGG